MEGMIPIEEFKNDDELSKLKVGSQIDVYLEESKVLKVRLLFQEIRHEK